MKLPAAAVAVALTVAACGSAEPATEPTPTPTAAQTPTMVTEVKEAPMTTPVAKEMWRLMGRESQDEFCAILLSPTSSDDNELKDSIAAGETGSFGLQDLPVLTDVALPVCERRHEKAEAKARAKAERQAEQERKMRERQHKIDAMTSDSSLTANQKVAVYDAVCEYLTQPGEANLFDLSERAIAALPQGSTPQQQWDASVDAGWLMGSGACR